MPRPRPPCRVDTVTFPVFGMSWFANPGDGTSVLAYCGGGGSAKTGVFNYIYVREPGNDEVLQISTGDQVGVALHLFQNPVSNRLWLVVAMGNTVHRYSLPDGLPSGKIDAGDGVNALAVNAMSDRIAVGCDSGVVKVYPIGDDALGDNALASKPLFICENHNKAICALAFSPREGRLVASAKDGTATLWKDNKLLANLKCSVADDNPRVPPPKRAMQVLVRGCAFGDLEGKVLYTVASAKRGKAFLSKWVQTSNKIECVVRTACSPVPISAMSLSGDGGLLVLGSVDGSVILWGVENWKPLKIFKEVHDLPVTSIAARPFPVPLQGESDGVQMHAVSASADSRMAWLTLQKPARSERKSSDFSLLTTIVGILKSWPWMVLVILSGYIVYIDIQEKCPAGSGYDSLQKCIIQEVLMADPMHPGVLSPPY